MRKKILTVVSACLLSALATTSSFSQQTLVPVISLLLEDDLERAELLINEIDYDQVGSDGEEFIELFNVSDQAGSLKGLSVVLINGVGSREYQRFDLDNLGVMPPRGHLVIGSSPVLAKVPEGVPTFQIPFATIQNGEPDAAAIYDRINDEVLDAISYEGSITEALITGASGTFNLVTGNPVSAIDSNFFDSVQQPTSIQRISDGLDTGDDDSDFILSPSLTPGRTNGIFSDRLVINEVNYDDQGEDLNEFVEIFNNTGIVQDLAGVSLVFVNGTNSSEYSRVDLTGSLPQGGYAVVGSQSLLNTINADIEIAFGAPSTNIQNGAPDAVALFDTATDTVIDSISYEGSIVSASINGAAGTFNLVNGNATFASDPGDGSLSRSPNGFKSDNDSDDWICAAAPTPGGENGSVACD